MATSIIKNRNTKAEVFSLPDGAGSVNAYKYGNVVTIKLYTDPDITITKQGWKTLMTLSQEYRPPGDLLFAIYNNSSNTSEKATSLLRVRGSGNIDVWVYNDNVSPAGTVTYCVS